jgi:hypothetical protein
MKTTKLFLTIAALVVGIITASAQQAGVYPLLSGYTTVLPAASTNVAIVYSTVIAGGVTNNVIQTNTFGLPGTSTNLVLPVSQFDYAGLTFAFTGTATSTNDLLIFKSFDRGATYEPTPSFTFTNLAPGAAAYLTNGALDIHGVNALGFVIKNKGTTIATNVLLEINLKSQKYFILPATR